MAKARHIGGIDCNAPAVSAIGRVLLTRLEEVIALRDRALDWNDPEGVHDMRVATRRLRGALSDFRPYTRKKHLSSVLKQIKHLAGVLGQVRDQDVAIMGLQKLAKGAPGNAAAALEHFIHLREKVRKKARTELQHSLRKTDLNRLQHEFTEAIGVSIAAPKTRKRKGITAEQLPEISYVEIARAVISERLEAMEKLSAGFFHPLKVKPLHDMRIAAKHLRYALELFEQCLGPSSSMFARKVAALQTSLGELHDCDIWINTFGEQLEAARREASRERLAGALWLLSHFVRLHSKHLRNSLAQWEEWETHDYSSQLRELLKPDAATPEAPAQSETAPPEPKPVEVAVPIEMPAAS